MISSFRRNVIKANACRTKKRGEESWLTKKGFGYRIICARMGVLPP